MESILRTAVTLMDYSGRRTLTSKHIQEALCVLYAPAADFYFEAGEALFAKYNSAPDALSKGEKMAINKVRRQAREILSDRQPPVRLNEDMAIHLQGVLARIAENVPVRMAVRPEDQVIEVACLALKNLRHKILTPKEILVAAKILRPDLDIVYKPESPRSGRTKTARVVLRENLKRRVAEVVEGGRVNKKAPACLEFVLQMMEPQKPEHAVEVPEPGGETPSSDGAPIISEATAETPGDEKAAAETPGDEKAAAETPGDEKATAETDVSEGKVADETASQ